MALKVLVETGFLLALNPKDRNHEWALGLLEESRRGNLALYVSPIAPVEVSLILRSRGFGEEEVMRVLEAMEDAIAVYTKPRYPSLSFSHAALAASLRRRYSELSFFDSLYASVAILSRLAYYDLDDTVRKVVERELTART